jgi:hypothetical protein
MGDLLEKDIDILDRDCVTRLLRPLVARLSQSPNFLIDEVEYVLSRFAPNGLVCYLTARREARGITPRVAQPLKWRILNQMITPYAEKRCSGVSWIGTTSQSQLGGLMM